MKKNKKTKWTDHFSKSAKGNNVFFVRGTKVSSSLWTVGGDGHNFKNNIYDILDSYKIPSYNQSSGGSPAGHLETEEIAYSFLDGGFVTSHCNAVYGTFGSWVIGYDALRFIISHIEELIPPKKSKNEKYIKSEDVMKVLLEQQLKKSEMLKENATQLYMKYGNEILI